MLKGVWYGLSSEQQESWVSMATHAAEVDPACKWEWWEQSHSASSTLTLGVKTEGSRLCKTVPQLRQSEMEMSLSVYWNYILESVWRVQS